MRGASRASLVEASERLAAVAAESPDPARLGEELFAAAHVLDSEAALRRGLADATRPPEARAALVTAVFGGKISDVAVSLLADVARLHWSLPGEMVDAIEELAVMAIVTAADRAGHLDDLEDEVFRFSRIVASQPGLRIALSNRFVAPEGKRELLNSLLAGKVTDETLLLVTQAALYSRGRSLDASLEEYARLAAEQRQQVVAEVHVAIELTGEQRSRLDTALSAAYGHRVHLNVVLDPEVIGGMSVRVGGELIDGSIASRLAELRRRLAG